VEYRTFPINKKQPLPLDLLDWADLLILQRIKSLYWRHYIKYARKKGIPVVYEMDDNLLEIPSGHPHYSFWDKIKNF